MKMKIFLGLAVVVLFATVSFAQITVENSATIGFGNLGTVDQRDVYDIPNFDMGAGDKLVVAVGNEVGTVPSFGVEFGGVALTQVSFATDGTGGERVHVYFLDGASGFGDIEVTLSAPGETQANGPGIYAASLSGASPGFELAGNFFDGQNVFGDVLETISGVSDGAYAIAVFADQGHPADIIIEGAFNEVSMFNGDNFSVIGSATSAVGETFGNGGDLTVGFNDGSPSGTNVEGPFQARTVIAYASFASAAGGLLGDINCDGSVDLLDVGPFVDLLTNGGFSAKADINGDGQVDLLDVGPFVDLLAG